MLTQAYVKELFDYYPDTGSLIWKVKRQGRGALNGPALACLSKGHLRGRIDGKGYLQHRVIWLWMTGHWPESQIDHINGNGADNRWSNLRSVTDAENKRNLPHRADNTSGVIGVYFHNAAQKWCAELKINGKKHYLGLFSIHADAVQARKQAERTYGFHPNHGRLS